MKLHLSIKGTGKTTDFPDISKSRRLLALCYSCTTSETDIPVLPVEKNATDKNWDVCF
jgi:hypothetical protein